MESQKHSYINAYVLSKDNAKTFVEFTLKVKNETESGFKSGTEYFYIVDKNNKENNMKLKKLPIGTILVIILNNYNRIKKVLENHKNMIYNAEKESNGDYKNSLNGLKEDLTDISKALSIFKNFIDSFTFDIYNKYNVDLYNLTNEIKQSEYFDHSSFRLKEKYIKIKEKTEKLKDDEETLNDYMNTLSLEEKAYLQSSNHYKNLQEQFIYMSTAQCLKDKCINFFDNWLNEFENMKKIVDNAFVPTYENSRYYTFSGITLQLPRPTIEFSKSKKAKETKYKYELSTLTDFIYASLYHLQLEGLRIIKCKRCKKYFIPTENNQVNCNTISDEKVKDKYSWQKQELSIKKFHSFLASLKGTHRNESLELEAFSLYNISQGNIYYKARGGELQTSVTHRLNQYKKQCKCSFFKHT